MRKLFITLTFLVLGTVTQKLSAQVNVNVNIGAQPNWGPAGYDYVEYYYLPDIESYYYVPRHQFVYLSNGRWVFAVGLPPAYRDYDLHRGYKVVINQPKAYMYYSSHKIKYAGFKKNYSQVIIRGNNGNGHGYERGNGHGNGRGHGNH